MCLAHLGFLRLPLRELAVPGFALHVSRHLALGVIGRERLHVGFVVTLEPFPSGRVRIPRRRAWRRIWARLLCLPEPLILGFHGLQPAALGRKGRIKPPLFRTDGRGFGRRGWDHRWRSHRSLCAFGTRRRVGDHRWRSHRSLCAFGTRRLLWGRGHITGVRRRQDVIAVLFHGRKSSPRASSRQKNRATWGLVHVALSGFALAYPGRGMKARVFSC